MPKSAKLSGIKSLRCYNTKEAADVTGVSERTIRSWTKRGLKIMSQERPTLIRGDALIEFIRAQRKSRKAKLGQHEFYCLKCRAPRESLDGIVECETNGVRAKLTTFCKVCGTIMHKSVAQPNVPQLSDTFDLTVRDNSETTNTLTAE